MVKPTRQKAQLTEQGEAFVKLARELGCDESEERFDAVLKAVAKHQPVGTPLKATSKAKRKSK